MSIMHNGRFKRVDIWREGEWLDLWSGVHFLSGILIGLGFYFLHTGVFASLALALFLLVSYEGWEMIVKIEETPANRFMDIVVGMLGFIAVFFLLAPLLSYELFVSVFALVLIVDIVMSIFGWRASQKAAALKKRMHKRYVAQRERLLGRRTHLGERFKR